MTKKKSNGTNLEAAADPSPAAAGGNSANGKPKNRKWQITLAVQRRHRGDAGEEKEDLESSFAEGGRAAARDSSTGSPSMSDDESSEGGADEVRRSSRATKVPRKVDEIYNYEHVRMTYAKKKPRAAESVQLISSTLDRIIPLDKAAQSTYLKCALNSSDKAERGTGNTHRETKGTNEAPYESDDQEWLEKVAASLGAAADASALPQKRPPRPGSRASPAPSLDERPMSTITCPSGSQVVKSDSSGDGADVAPEEVANGVPVYLSECEEGKRHGRLVFHKNDTRRRCVQKYVDLLNTRGTYR